MGALFSRWAQRRHTAKRARSTLLPVVEDAIMCPLIACNFLMLLGAVPSEDWYRNWAPARTTMLRRTSKVVQAMVDQMRLPVEMSLNRMFWG